MRAVNQAASPTIPSSSIYGLTEQSKFHQQLGALPEDGTMYTITIVNFHDKKSQSHILTGLVIRDIMKHYGRGADISLDSQLNGIIVRGNGIEIIYRGATFTNKTDPRLAFPERVNQVLSQSH